MVSSDCKTTILDPGCNISNGFFNKMGYTDTLYRHLSLDLMTVFFRKDDESTIGYFSVVFSGYCELKDESRDVDTVITFSNRMTLFGTAGTSKIALCSQIEFFLFILACVPSFRRSLIVIATL